MVEVQSDNDVVSMQVNGLCNYVKIYGVRSKRGQSRPHLSEGFI